MAFDLWMQQGVLIAVIQADLSDAEVRRLRDQVARLVGVNGATRVVVDVGGMDVIDSFTARALRSMAQSARLRGAAVLVIGIRPEVAIAMVQFHVDLAPVETARDLADALTRLVAHDRRSSP
jgi:rsbT antagonist protein RsbS